MVQIYENSPQITQISTDFFIHHRLHGLAQIFIFLICENSLKRNSSVAICGENHYVAEKIE